MTRRTRDLERALAVLLGVACWVGLGAPAGAADCTGLNVDPAADDDKDGFINAQECDPEFPIFVSQGVPGSYLCENPGSGYCAPFSLEGPFTPDLFANLFPTAGAAVCPDLFPGATSLLTLEGHDPLAVLSNGLHYAVHRDVVDRSFALDRRISPQSQQRLLRLVETALDGPIGEFGSIQHGFVNDSGDGVIHTGTICRFVLGKCPRDADCNNAANDTPEPTPDTRQQIVTAQIENTVAHESGHGSSKLTRAISRKDGPHESAGTGRVMEKFIDVSCGRKGQPPCHFGISTEFSGTDLRDATIIDTAAQ